MKTCYAFKSLYDSAYTVTGSSDAPIEDPNPWLGIWAAVDVYKRQVAMCVFFLCSDMAPWVTGSSLVVDGGGIA